MRSQRAPIACNVHRDPIGGTRRPALRIDKFIGTGTRLLANSRAWVALLVFVAATALLDMVHLPAPTLFAAMLAAGGYAMSTDSRLALQSTVRDIGMATVGVTAGASIDADAVHMIAEEPVAVLVGVMGTLVISLVVGQLLRLSPGISGRTATFASIAGGASGVSLVAREFGADDALVLVIQYLRVVLVLTTIPLVAPLLESSGKATTGVVEFGTSTGWPPYLFFATAATGGLLAARVLGFTAAEILLPLSMATALSISGVFGDVTAPTPLVAAGYAVLGVSVGLGFTRSRLRRILRHLPIAVAQIVLGVLACAIAGLMFARAVGIPPLDGYLATSPGGLAAIIAVALDSSDQVGLILTMQFVRVFLALSMAPAIGYYLRKRDHA